MTEHHPYETVTERITTVDDGEDTVNERLSTGGPGPNGELDTVTERLSGAPVDEPKSKRAKHAQD